jgi:diguanylate cyclase (GGDEF)-like protein
METEPDRGAVDGEGAIPDLLTGLGDERHLRLQLSEDFTLARARGANGTLLAVKLDNLLGINARHGRTGGDEALRALTYILANLRPAPGRETNTIVKVGGPVFGYLIPSCTVEEGKAVADEILRRVMESELYLERLTVSIGLANFLEFFPEEGTREELALRLEQTAFHRLALAEQRGANTICDSSAISAETMSTRPRVLMIEPDPTSMELLVRALEATGVVVHIRQDGEGALQFVQDTPPSLIICEAMTPRLNGFAIRERLRTNASWNAIPFILVSHKKNEDLIRKAVEYDIRHFFRKPVSLAEVVGLVTNMTRSAGR